MASPVSFARIRLDLTNSRWLIYAGDADASRIVSALGDAMSLPAIQFQKKQSCNGQHQELQVLVDSELDQLATDRYGSELTPCIVPSPVNNDMLVVGMMYIAQAIIRAEQSRGGILIHGALAQPPIHLGGGILLAGPGNVGKTTSSNRLPSTWQSHSDDASLVVRDGKGTYWAHPWPTWSRFFSTPDGNPGPGGRWKVEQKIPLRTIFFLRQAERDRIEPVSFTPALTYLMETAQQVSHPIIRNLPFDQALAFQKKQVATAEALIRSIPFYTLHLSLTGTFWKKIEKKLASEPICPSIQPDHAPADVVVPVHRNDTILTVSYSGPSMNPTLRHPDLLEVVPSPEQSIRRGDVVYFQSPQDGMKVIHRVVRVATDGIRTRGDNNATDDPYFLQQEDIIGRVFAAWRHGKRRKIARGLPGICSGYKAAAWRRMSSIFSRVLHGTYHTIAASGFFRCLLPASLQPRVFEFKQRYLPSILKLMVRGRVIGRYDIFKGLWVIERPWRLIIDESKLPVVSGAPSMDQPHLDNAIPEKRIA